MTGDTGNYCDFPAFFSIPDHYFNHTDFINIYRFFSHSDFYPKIPIFPVIYTGFVLDQSGRSDTVSAASL